MFLNFHLTVKTKVMHHSWLDVTTLVLRLQNFSCSTAADCLFCSFPEIKRKLIFISAGKLRFTVSWPGLCFLVKSIVVSFQNVTGSHWQFVATFHSCLRNLTSESTEGVSHFCCQAASDTNRKESHLLGADHSRQPRLTQALNKSEIHWPLRVDHVKLCIFNNSNLTLQPCCCAHLFLEWWVGTKLSFHLFRNVY